jgi:hypothetical protein
MPASFRIDDSNSNAYARYPVKSLQKIAIFNNSNWSIPQLIASGDTTVVGSRISKILISTDDTLDNLIKFYLHDGTSLSTLPFSFESVPALSGSGLDVSKITINCLRSTKFEPFIDYDNNNNTYLFLETGYSIWAVLQNAISATKFVQTIAWLDDY